MLISQARNKLFESFRGLKSSSGHGLCIRIVIRSLLSSTKDTPILDILEVFLRGDQSMKVVSYDPSDTAGPSGSLPRTSCTPQPHLEVMRTPPFLMYLETFPRGDHSMKVSYCNPLDTPGPPGPGSINHQSCVCVCVRVCVCVCVPAGSVISETKYLLIHTHTRTHTHTHIYI